MTLPRIPKRADDTPGREPATAPSPAPARRHRYRRSVEFHRPFTWLRIAMRVLRGILRLRRGRF
jgi:hypothetical protein